MSGNITTKLLFEGAFSAILSAPQNLEIRTLAADRRIIVSVSDDAMMATVRLLPGQVGAADSVTIALRRAGIHHGVIETGVNQLADKLLTSGQVDDEILVAQGTDATPADGGYFEPEFADEAPAGEVGAGKLQADGSIILNQQ